jgi:hypothetical protein
MGGLDCCSGCCGCWHAAVLVVVVVGSSGWGSATGDDGASAVGMVSVGGSAGSVTGGGCGCDVWLAKPALRCAFLALNISARRSFLEDIDRGAPEEKLAGGLAGIVCGFELERAEGL